MEIEIDSDSGFCFGVTTAINKAEEELLKEEPLYCLGDIVHNSMEVNRLSKKGLKTIDHNQFFQLRNKKVLLRAHGEPPSTYEIAKENGIEIIDATCPVVLNLQKNIKKAYLSSNTEDTQIVIYGKIGHAEVNGLVGQTEGHAIVIESLDDLNKIDFTKKIKLFSQTTKSIGNFEQIVEKIKENITDCKNFEFNDTICRQVANRIPKIINFVSKHELVFFVSGKKSSNGKVLLDECRKINSNIHLISDLEELDFSMLEGVNTVGICGATSTPKWLMEELKSKIERYLETKKA
ncbi:MAG TPA: 4-hydroxy-3-methylbut-2-enyl diphosphate reductase [Paludibacteraceae bacterium]|nr:4-hydroxy-3-methylbut-2-enyl diphosphate reductase [Paludibacteraceae bacterium]HPH62119.1 4-hydroxy-3-methylbut-2-enyl diphosphate reductase [Paludibacteraceae bacterium]HQF49331.1 4-hydroxy-3-methylbut-2-enyl diphosphate reductase [Paludibacteraceae bacterium]